MVKIVLEYRPAYQVEMDKKFTRLLLDNWNGEGNVIEYLMITLPIMWAGYVKLN